MKRLLVVLALALVPTWASASRVSMTGLYGRTGSITSAGDEPAIFLRWDVSEGAFPAALVSFRLLRGDEELATLPVTHLMTRDAVAALYGDPAHERRRLEMIRWLDLNEPTFVVDESNFADVLVERLQDDSFFAHEASRIDPLIAVVRHRGYVDTDLANLTAPPTYRLEGVLEGGATVTLGQVEVDTTAPDVVPEAAGFRQLSPEALARCDAPEAFKAHGTVALDWDHPGSEPGAPPAERLTWELAIAGYDLYRSDKKVGTLAPRDLRAEAELLPHDDFGAVPFSGLVKVNDAPLLVTSGLPERELGNLGFAPETAQHVETWPELEQAGMQPGETWAYYLVARDVTGNYGQTTAVLVEVPDLLAPPSPWNVQAVPLPAQKVPSDVEMIPATDLPDRMAIRWPLVDVVNYVQSFGSDRTFCDLESAVFSGKLSFVDRGTCPSPADDVAGRAGALMRLNLDVTHYVVYRFESPAEARAFVDSDGDGVADAAERVLLTDPVPGGPELTDPGLACDPEASPPGAANHRVALVSAEDGMRQLRSGRWIMELTDPVPGTSPGDVYWYRIAAVTSAGRIGPLSRPVRARFPEYRRKGRDSLRPWTCQLGIEQTTSPVIGEGPKPAVTVHLSCDAIGGEFTASLAGGDYDTPGLSGAWPSSVCSLNPLCPSVPDGCGSFYQACRDKPVTVTYRDAAGEPVAGSKEITNWDVCSQLHTKLVGDCWKADPNPPNLVKPSTPLDVAVYPEEGCVGIYREIGGKLQRTELICDPLALPEEVDVPTLGASRVCLYTAVHDGGRVSGRLLLDCYTTESATPEPPQPLGLSFNEDGTAEIRLRPPDQRLIGTIVEWSRADGSDRASRLVVQPADLDVLGAVVETVDLGAPMPPPGESDEWCFRARSVVSQSDNLALAETLSDWSASLCQVRQASGSQPEYLPWPTIPTPPDENLLRALYVVNDALPIVKITPLDDEEECPTDGIETCSHWHVSGLEPGAGPCLPLITTLSTSCDITCSDVQAMVGPSLRFVAYRQHREDAADEAGPYVQVSPLIDRIHCTDEAGSITVTGIPGLIVSTVADPYLTLLGFEDVGPAWDGEQFVFVDRHPHIIGEQYRYQFVYFDARGEITKTRTSGWITAGGAP